MMILIAVLVGLSIGAFWLYRRRPVAMRVGRPAAAAENEDKAPETVPGRVPDDRPRSANRAPSAESQLRDSLLATEVVEVGFDDQLASDLRDGELERAIFLLKQLIQARPDDIRHRMRLLLLLYEERRPNDFVREATDAKRLKPPLDAQAWLQVCAWGSEIDPGNHLFTVPGPRAVTTAERPNAVNACGVPMDKSTCPPLHTVRPQGGSERRSGKDRRVSNSPWLGVERRKANRRRSAWPKRSKVPQTASSRSG